MNNPTGWKLETQSLTLEVTAQGGMVAPVSFRLDNNRVAQPYYISPWQGENLNPQPPVLGSLRGDFFCLPFGGDNNLEGEQHLPHGESAYGTWQEKPLQDESSRVGMASGADSNPRNSRAPQGTGRTGSFYLNYQACPGMVEKTIYLGSDAPWFATQHVLEGFQGAYPLGHHATLQGSDDHDWKIFTQPFDLGMVDPSMDRVGDREYYSLQPGAQFTRLDQVPTCWSQEPVTDISRFPNRKGFIDIAGIYRKPPAHSGWDSLGWTCAYNLKQGYLWYSFKDLRILPATMFWMENHGRHGSPWLGRNCCIGLEETCSFMAAGRVGSVAPNPVQSLGIPTAHHLEPQVPFKVRTIQGVVDLVGKVQPGIDPGAQKSMPLVQDVEFQIDNQGRGSFVVRLDSPEIKEPILLPLDVDLAWVLGDE